MGGEADNVTEINLGTHFNHSVRWGSWVGDVNAGPCLREQRPAGRRWSCGSGRTKERLLRLQVYPLDVSHWPSSTDCPGGEEGGGETRTNVRERRELVSQLV